MSYKFDQEIDCSGLSCPMPILKTKKELDTMTAGKVLKMTSTDPGSVPDIEAYTKKTGHELLGHEEDAGKYIFYIKKS